MIGYTDADWENCKINQKSITRWMFKSAGGPISWSSKKQHTVAISSTEEKEKALTDGIREAVWLRTLPSKIQGTMPNPITIFCDNQSTLKANTTNSIIITTNSRIVSFICSPYQLSAPSVLILFSL